MAGMDSGGLARVRRGVAGQGMACGRMVGRVNVRGGIGVLLQ